MNKRKLCKVSGEALKRGWPRFWFRVKQGQADECWPWMGAKTSRGYGAFGCDGKQWQAHRFAYAAINGEFPDYLEVRHMCEGRYPAGDFSCRLCCNPAHLAIGTHLENMRDKLTTGRMGPGRVVRSSKREQPARTSLKLSRAERLEQTKQWLADRRKEG